MSDFFDQEEILKSYDAKIMKRILGYLRPYLVIFILAISALVRTRLRRKPDVQEGNLHS